MAMDQQFVVRAGPCPRSADEINDVVNDVSAETSKPESLAARRADAIVEIAVVFRDAEALARRQLNTGGRTGQ